MTTKKYEKFGLYAGAALIASSIALGSYAPKARTDDAAKIRADANNYVRNGDIINVRRRIAKLEERGDIEGAASLCFRIKDDEHGIQEVEELLRLSLKENKSPGSAALELKALKLLADRYSF